MSTAAIDSRFWRDQLEVNIDLVLKQHADDDFIERWLHDLTLRPRQMLIEHFGIDGKLKSGDVRRAILARRAELVPFRLAEEAAAGKRTYAILEVARAKLAPAIVEQCRIHEDSFDRLALTWQLYLDSPNNLELVFHLHWTQQRGFARMVLPSPSPSPPPSRKDAAAFFDRERIQRMLDEFEAGEPTLRQSHCAAILRHGGNYQVLIKRDRRPAFVAHGSRNTFGFWPEWIVLEFEPDLRRVYISSVSPEVPLRLANAIAGKYFGTTVGFANESIATPTSRVDAFLRSLVDHPERLPIVELIARNCGLEMSPQLRLNLQDDASLAPAIRQFSRAFGDLLDAAEIDSIKVRVFDKRVKIVFEPSGDDEGFVVRYASQPLTSAQRCEFETRMAKDYRITMLSMEKRHGR